jgi:hypothetical protein
LHGGFDLGTTEGVEVGDSVVDQPLGGVRPAGDIEPEHDGRGILGGSRRTGLEGKAGDGCSRGGQGGEATAIDRVRVNAHINSWGKVRLRRADVGEVIGLLLSKTSFPRVCGGVW